MAKILIVDDSASALSLLTDMLEEEGHSVWPCTKADCLEDRISGFLPDVILLDVVMPQRSGYDILRSLKKDDKTKNIPVIFISSKQEPSDVQWGLRQGAVDYITKPFTAERVLSAIAPYLPRTD